MLPNFSLLRLSDTDRRNRRSWRPLRSSPSQSTGGRLDFEVKGRDEFRRIRLEDQAAGLDQKCREYIVRLARIVPYNGEDPVIYQVIVSVKGERMANFGFDVMTDINSDGVILVDGASKFRGVRNCSRLIPSAMAAAVKAYTFAMDKMGLVVPTHIIYQDYIDPSFYYTFNRIDNDRERLLEADDWKDFEAVIQQYFFLYDYYKKGEYKDKQGRVRKGIGFEFTSITTRDELNEKIAAFAKEEWELAQKRENDPDYEPNTWSDGEFDDLFKRLEKTLSEDNLDFHGDLMEMTWPRVDDFAVLSVENWTAYRSLMDKALYNE